MFNFGLPRTVSPHTKSTTCLRWSIRDWKLVYKRFGDVFIPCESKADEDYFQLTPDTCHSYYFFIRPRHFPGFSKARVNISRVEISN